MKQFEREFGRDGLDRIDHFGFVEDRESYWQWLSKADWVLSTARHEFFGIAVVEALLFGCGGKGALPWLPPELSYPELLPEAARGLSPMNPPGDSGDSGDAVGVRAAIRKHLEPAIAENAVRRIDELLNEVRVSK